VNSLKNGRYEQLEYSVHSLDADWHKALHNNRDPNDDARKLLLWPPLPLLPMLPGQKAQDDDDG
jgi:hypothetical protein